MIAKADQLDETLEDIDDDDINYRFRLSRDTVRAILPPRKERTWDIVRNDIRGHNNEPFAENDYPWTEGICDAFDDPNVREVVLQFSARIGKTFIAQSMMISAAWKSPATGMFASSTEQLVKDTIKKKYWPMFAKCKRTRKWVPSKARQLQTRMDLSQMTMYCAWSGSDSTLADKDPKYKHGGEIDKWDFSSSTEADPLELFMERGIEIPDRKSILESTPGIEGKSRINSWLMLGWNCRFHVPCVHKSCGHYQELVLGDGSGGGIVFDKDPDGEINPDIAFKTARYRCCKCKKEIPEEKRRGMISKGIWCAEGQYITKSGKVRGNMARGGEVASFQLSRIYAPTFNFGDIARQFVRCKLKERAGNDEPMRSFFNSWLGLTWTPRKLITTWDVLGPKLSTSNQKSGFNEYNIGNIPSGCNFATMGVDWQADHYVYTKVAWNHLQAGFVYGYGVCYHEQDLIDEILRPGRMKTKDGEIDLYPRLTLNDARDGNRHDEVIDFCRKMNKPREKRLIWPSMGTNSGQMRGKTFTRNEIDGTEGLKSQKAKKKNSKMFYWISVNTNYWQQWIQNCLVKRDPGEAYSLALPVEARDDQDFLDQLLNEQSESKKDTTGHEGTVWMVVNETIPWDFRDCVRYARCAAEVFNNGNWNRIVPDSIHNTTPPTSPAATPNPEKAPTSTSRKRRSAVSKTKNWLKRQKGKRFIKG